MAVVVIKGPWSLGGIPRDSNAKKLRARALTLYCAAHALTQTISGSTKQFMILGQKRAIWMTLKLRTTSALLHPGSIQSSVCGSKTVSVV